MEPQPPKKDGLSPQEEARISLILSQNLADSAGVSSTSPETGRFSMAALAYGPIYFWKMGDTVFAILSVIFAISIYLVPGLIVLAFLARRRAWEIGHWKSVVEFNAVQKRWDTTANYMLAVTVLLIVILYKIAKPLLTSSLGNAGFGSSGGAQDQLKQVQDAVNDN